MQELHSLYVLKYKLSLWSVRYEWGCTFKRVQMFFHPLDVSTIKQKQLSSRSPHFSEESKTLLYSLIKLQICQICQFKPCTYFKDQDILVLFLLETVIECYRVLEILPVRALGAVCWVCILCFWL